jgi:hypothetical protein
MKSIVLNTRFLNNHFLEKKKITKKGRKKKKRNKLIIIQTIAKEHTLKYYQLLENESIFMQSFLSLVYG